MIPVMRAQQWDRWWGSFLLGDGCWSWIASKNNYGYGQFPVGYSKHAAHRMSYEMFSGPIATGMQIDHLCRNRSCVNPAHMEVVTQAENMRRGGGVAAENGRRTSCRSGHAYSKENTYRWVDKYGSHRRCKTCDSNRYIANRDRKRNG